MQLKSNAHIILLANQGDKCKTSLAHGFHFQKVTAGLSELLKSAPQTFAADPRIHAKNSDIKMCATDIHQLMF